MGGGRGVEGGGGKYAKRQEAGCECVWGVRGVGGGGISTETEEGRVGSEWAKRLRPLQN